VNEHLQTSQKHIYACGDVIGSFQFTHYAAWQASMHVYPTYTIGVQQLAADVRLESLAASRTVKLARGLASFRRT